MQKNDFVKDFVERSQERLGRLEADLLNLEVNPSVFIHPVLRTIVSIRTEAEMIGMKHVEEITKYLTDSLEIVRDHSLQPDSELITLFLKLLDSLEYSLQEVAYSWDLKDLETHITIQVKPTVQTLNSYLSTLIRPTIFFSEIERIFPLKNAAHTAARDYSKQVEVEIFGGDILIPQLLLKRLPRLLTHLINNAITHGIEMPEVRQSLGKPMTGKLTLTAVHQNQQVIIFFADDGAGIDVERVKTKAVSKGLMTATDAAYLSDLDTYEFLFHPDFSTKDIRDMRAGTGYGLDIVRSELRKIGGNISVHSVPQQGTTFTIVYSL